MRDNKPTCEDFAKAKSEWCEENPEGNWDSLRTQTKNRLAKLQMFHRHYHDLSAAIMGVKGKVS